MTPAQEQAMRELLGIKMRQAFSDVTDADVDGAWERFKPDAEKAVAANLLDPGHTDAEAEATFLALYRAVALFVHCEGMEAALSEPGSGYVSVNTVGPDGKLKQLWGKRQPSAEEGGGE